MFLLFPEAVLNVQVPTVNREVPILFCHGRADGMVRFDFGQLSSQTIQKLGFSKLVFRAYDDLGHCSGTQVLPSLPYPLPPTLHSSPVHSSIISSLLPPFSCPSGHAVHPSHYRIGGSHRAYFGHFQDQDLPWALTWAEGALYRVAS